MTRIRFTPSRRSARGFTLVETLIASAISLVCAALLVQMNILAATYAASGFREAKMIKDASQVMDQMTRYLNGAYGTQSSNTAYAYAIQNSNTTVEFSVPSAGVTPNRERYRYDSTGKKLYHERFTGGAWSQIEGSALLANVLEFDVATQTGLINLVVRLQILIPRLGGATEMRQYTLIGRALPRNL